MNEEWIDIPNYPSYMVSSEGRIMSKKTQRMVKPYLQNGGVYLRVRLRNVTRDDEQLYVDMLVADVFLDPVMGRGYILEHVNDDPQDNRASNLRWVRPDNKPKRYRQPRTR